MGDSVAAVQALAKALGFVAWVLIIAWLVLFTLGHEQASGWCLMAAGVSVFAAAPLFRSADDRQTRITGLVMVPCGLFFLVFGLVLVL